MPAAKYSMPGVVASERLPRWVKPVDPALVGRTANFALASSGAAYATVYATTAEPIREALLAPARAAREVSPLVGRIPEAYPDSKITAGMIRAAHFTVLVIPMLQDVVGDVERVLWVLLGSVGCILLIACANVANLFLVRAEGRQREVAVRAALGASRGDVALLFLGESVALSLLGGVLGLALAWAGVRLLVSLRPASKVSGIRSRPKPSAAKVTPMARANSTPTSASIRPVSATPRPAATSPSRSFGPLIIAVAPSCLRSASESAAQAARAQWG